MKKGILLIIFVLNIFTINLIGKEYQYNPLLKIHRSNVVDLFKEINAQSDKSILYRSTHEEVEKLPEHLQLYVLILLDKEQKHEEIVQLNRYLDAVRIKTIQKFPVNLLSLSPEAFLRQQQIEFDMDFKFKGIRRPKNELPPQLNFRAREALAPEGFEAGEIISSKIMIHPQWNVFARLGLYEQWISEFVNYEEKQIIENRLSALNDFENHFKGTMKYGMGLNWQFITKTKRRLALEAILEQKSHNEWLLKEYLFSHKGFSGLLFDNLKFTFTFDF